MAIAAAVEQKVQKLVAVKRHREASLAARPVGRAIVSFTFDDFPQSAWKSGGRILGEYGASGTYYTSLGLMGKTTPVGRMFEREDLEAVAEAGHEVACHTYDHALCCNLNDADLRANCERTNCVWRRFGRLQAPKLFFPEGVVTLSVEGVV